MWSLGCVIGELLSGAKSLFFADWWCSELGTLIAICQALGSPAGMSWPSLSKLNYTKGYDYKPSRIPKFPRPTKDVMMQKAVRHVPAAGGGYLSQCVRACSSQLKTLALSQCPHTDTASVKHGVVWLLLSSAVAMTSLIIASKCGRGSSVQIVSANGRTLTTPGWLNQLQSEVPHWSSISYKHARHPECQQRRRQPANGSDRH